MTATSNQAEPKIFERIRGILESARTNVAPTVNTTRTRLMMRNAPRTESWQPGCLHPNLSWTHYRTLLRVQKPEARNFYEIKAVARLPEEPHVDEMAFQEAEA